jgi:hypothetical protein
LDRRWVPFDLYQQHDKITVDATGLNDMIYEKIDFQCDVESPRRQMPRDDDHCVLIKRFSCQLSRFNVPFSFARQRIQITDSWWLPGHMFGAIFT